MRKWILILFVLLAVGCAPVDVVENSKVIDTEDSVATFAGGCFWCMEAAFEELDGVSEVISGYAGGVEVDPSYYDVAGGKTSHREAVQIYYDSSVVSYSELLDYYFRQIDPTDADGQFVDKGFQYTTAVFYVGLEEQEEAEASLERLKSKEMFDKPIVTEIIEFTNFYEAEENHQDYYKKRTVQYKIYAEGSGREKFKEIWS